MPERNESAERTESATPKRRREAREEGQVARSQEVNSFVILTAGTLITIGFHSYVIEGIEKVFVQSFNLSPSYIEPGNMSRIAMNLFMWFCPIVAPFFLGIIGVGFLVNVGQVGFHISPKALSPKFDKLNPVNGLKRILSWRAVLEACKSAMKIGVIGFISYKVFRPAINDIMALSLGSSPDIVGTIIRIGGSIVLRALIVMIVVAALDYAFQFWQHEKSIKMTLREVRDELKETEGDPLVRQKMKSIQREMARRRMMEAVKEADVVITNPTSIAVALKYKPEFHAPKIIAKGRKHLAERIRKIAVDARVPVVENKPLAWALFESCKIGELVPVHLYKAVAEILAYVFSLKNKVRL